MIQIYAAHFTVVGYSVVIKMSYHTGFRPAKHFSFSQCISSFYRPFRELSQTLVQFLTAGSAFDLESTMPGFATVECKTKKSKLFRLFSPCGGITSGEATKFDTPGLFCRQLEMEVP